MNIGAKLCSSNNRGNYPGLFFWFGILILNIKMKYALPRVLIILATLSISMVIAYSQTPTERSFDTNPDSVYGVLVGILVAFGAAMLGFGALVVKKLFGWLGEYMAEKQTRGMDHGDKLDTIIEKHEESNKILTNLVAISEKQGLEITQINEKVTLIETDLEGVKGEIESIKQKLPTD